MPTPARSLRELLEQYFGVPYSPVTGRGASSVGTTVMQVLRQVPVRLGATIVNLSLNNVYLSPKGDVSSSNGIKLQPNGGSLTLDWHNDGELVAWEWFGIADGAASALYVVEIDIVAN